MGRQEIDRRVFEWSRGRYTQSQEQQISDLVESVLESALRAARPNAHDLCVLYEHLLDQRGPAEPKERAMADALKLVGAP